MLWGSFTYRQRLSNKKQIVSSLSMKGCSVFFLTLFCFLSFTNVCFAQPKPQCDTTVGCSCTDITQHGASPSSCTSYDDNTETVLGGDLFDSYDDTNGPFSLLMVSDLQYDYINCKNQPLNRCIFTPAPSAPVEDLNAAAYRQKECAQQQINLPGSYPVKLLMDGGDLTNDAKPDELTKYKEFYDMMGRQNSIPSGDYETYDPQSTTGSFSKMDVSIPFALTLGNHDYSLHSGDISYVDASNMIEFLRDSLRRIKSTSGANLISADWKEYKTGTPAGDPVLVEGSLFYSVNVEGIVFVVMHWGPFDDSPDSPDSPEESPVYHYSCYFAADRCTKKYKITDGYKYLHDAITSAEENGKGVILVPHNVEALPVYLDRAYRDTSYGSALKTLVMNHVQGVLSGHDHDQYGRYGSLDVSLSADTPADNLQRGTSNSGVPVYYAGSPSYEAMIRVQFDGNEIVDVIPLTTAEDGDSGNPLCTPIADDNITKLRGP